jgi:proton-dependent oligopeptide transporter, POT family
VWGCLECEQPLERLASFSRKAFSLTVQLVLGAYLADEFWGRYVTIQAAIACAMVGHILLIVSAVPSVISNPDGSLACFTIGLIIFGIGVGGFKSNISPLIAEQYEYKQPKSTVETLPSGERVIVDVNMTISRIYLWYYFMINVGSLIGQIAMVYGKFPITSTSPAQSGATTKVPKLIMI